MQTEEALHEPYTQGGPRLFQALDAQGQKADPLRRRITAAYRAPETECVPPLVMAATMLPDAAARIRATAGVLVEAARRRGSDGFVDGLLKEYSLSSDEGVALMCLAEAFLRIPDAKTRDALIRDKIAGGDWLSHVDLRQPLFVNAAGWGLALTGKLADPMRQADLSRALQRAAERLGRPVIRKTLDIAMRVLGRHYVMGQTIEEAIANGRSQQAKGFLASFDMLGEAAMTAADARDYYVKYEQAIQAIGATSRVSGDPYGAPGVSIKLSALHPRYHHLQRERVLAELYPRLLSLAKRAARYGIGLNIDAEEADRLDLSLDLLEMLCREPDLSGWQGLGFVVQAYSKRCPFVIDFLVALARGSGRRLMVRLVKGAYWDAEIKRAQVDGLAGYPVFTRKVYSDVSYLACARRLLDAPDAIFPQFATHNAQTIASILEMAGPDFRIGQYEFQCLHGMGSGVYREIVESETFRRPCRIYAPVGSHDALLAYLVRRLLENGANSSFVNQIGDDSIAVDDLIADPVEVAKAIVPLGAPHAQIGLPADIYGTRKNASGMDLSDANACRHLGSSLRGSLAMDWRSVPLLHDGEGQGTTRPVLNPADRRDRVGTVTYASRETVEIALENAQAAFPLWAGLPAAERGERLISAAEALESQMPRLLGLIVREAGKSVPNAIAEVREAVDFLRYYGLQAREELDNRTHKPLGVVACISPWNFPLAIFLGQVAGALAAGNVVIAKPAEETPLIAAEAARIMRGAGIPPAALQVMPGEGDVGAQLVASPIVQGVAFTGSLAVARHIQAQLAARLLPDGRPVPFIAETGGQNAMIVDSSALPEQVVADVLASAFDSAGQRCSALRILCLQDDIADRVLKMLIGAMEELRVGSPDSLATDIGPVIDADAQRRIEAHIERMAVTCPVRRAGNTPEDAFGTFVSPTVIEIENFDDLGEEVFGPVLHVCRWSRASLPKMIEAINRLGYGLTFGLHTRLDQKADEIARRIDVGNVYINRNMVGAVVGVQPFGGHGLSGTGPKAGGPLYIRRLLSACPVDVPCRADGWLGHPAAGRYCDWLESRGRDALAALCRSYVSSSRLGLEQVLPGPVGELNRYAMRAQGHVLLFATTQEGLLHQLGAVLATGNMAVVPEESGAAAILDTLPPDVAAHVVRVGDWRKNARISTILAQGDAAFVASVCRDAVGMPGSLKRVLAPEGAAPGRYRLEDLIREVSISINTAVAGGNASLLALG